MEEKVLKKKYSVKSERVKTVPYRSVIIRNHKSIRDKKNIYIKKKASRAVGLMLLSGELK